MEQHNIDWICQFCKTDHGAKRRREKKQEEEAKVLTDALKTMEIKENSDMQIEQPQQDVDMEM